MEKLKSLTSALEVLRKQPNDWLKFANKMEDLVLRYYVKNVIDNGKKPSALNLLNIYNIYQYYSLVFQ